jgi:hypothetical protein
MSSRKSACAGGKMRDDFQAACFNLWQLAITYSVYRESQNDPVSQIASGQLWKSDAAVDAATKDLHLIGGRLKVGAPASPKTYSRK